MFEVDPVSRETINAWPIADAGLPTRVINSVKAANVRSVGELRQWSDSDLLKLRSLGKVSLDQIHYFYKLCSRVEKSVQRFNSINEVLDIFLDSAQLAVVSLRYGFHERDLVASRNWMTLQEIGNRDNKTRERIRQVEETGKIKLKSRMASVCLQPFYSFLRDFMKERAHAIATEELSVLGGHEAFGELNPASVVLLLSDLNPDQIVFHHDFFSTLSRPVIRAMESHATAVLRDSAIPVSVKVLTRGLEPDPVFRDPAQIEHAMSVIMDHCPDVAATVDGRYFLYASSAAPFLVELLEGLPGPVHYRKVTSAFNERVKPRSRKGAGYILEALNRNPRCSRADRGIYALLPGPTTTP